MIVPPLPVHVLFILVSQLVGVDGGDGADGILAAAAHLAACPGQMGVDAQELHARYSAKGAVDGTTRRALLWPVANAPEGSAIIGGVLPPSVCRMVSKLAAPLLEPTVQKRDSVDGEPEFQLDLLEPDSPHADSVCPFRDHHILNRTDMCFVNVTLVVWPHLTVLLCMPVERALRDTCPTLAATGAAPTAVAVYCHCIRWSISVGWLAEAIVGG